LKDLIARLKSLYPELKFSAGTQFCWSPETQEIFYARGAKGSNSEWSLLHETGHALLDHTTYKADFELLKLEVAAWEKAKELAKSLNIKIDSDHIEDCLDTYRDWLHKRSVCPNCTTQCLQQDDLARYRCFNCHTEWKVSKNRFCRAYRSTQNLVKA